MAESSIRRRLGRAREREEAYDDDDMDVAMADADYVDEEPRSGRRWGGLFLGLAALLVFGLFASVIWFAYRDGAQVADGAEAPLLRADLASYKTEPADPGGEPILNAGADVTDVLNGRTTLERDETLLPGEQRPSDAEIAAAAGEGAFRQLEAQRDDASQLTPFESPGETESAALSSGDGVTISPLPGTSAGQVGGSGLSVTRGAPNAAEESGDLPGYSRPPERESLPVLEAQPAAQTTPAASQVAAATPSANLAPVDLGPEELLRTHRLQLLASRDPDAAGAAWERLKNAYPTVLGPLASVLQRADTDNGVFFRLQAGPFASRDAANNACDQLKSLGGDCFVATPRP